VLKSRRTRPQKREPGRRRGKRRYGAGEWFLAILGVAFLVLFVILVIGAFVS